MGGMPCWTYRRWDPYIGISWHGAFFPPLPVIDKYFHLSFGISSGVTQLFALPSTGNDKEIISSGSHLMGRLRTHQPAF